MFEFIQNLSPKVFDQLAINHPLGSYLQTSIWKDFGETHDGFEGLLTGIKKGDELVAVALVTIYRDAKLTMAYIPRGPLMDYQDDALVQFYLRSLKKMINELKVDYLRMTFPNIWMRENQKEELISQSDSKLLDILRKENYHETDFLHDHLGVQPKYNFILDITVPYQTIKKGFHSSRKTAINKNNTIYHIDIEEGNLNHLDDLIELRKQLSLKKFFFLETTTYLETLFNQMNTVYPVKYYIAKIHLPAVELNLSKEIQLNLSQLQKLQEKDNIKAINKAKEVMAIIQNLEESMKLLKAYQEQHPNVDEVIAGVQINIWAGRQSHNLIMHTDHDLDFLNIPVLLHDYAIQDAQNHQLEIYDFFGVPKITGKDDPNFGLYTFKKGFGGDLIEYPGCYDYVAKPLKYRFIQWLRFRKFKQMQRQINITKS